jgi:gliding motility-associated-like protein
MKKNVIFLLFMALWMPFATSAQSVDPKAYYYDVKESQNVETTLVENGEAPLDVTFRANPTDMEGHNPAYEWHFRRSSKDQGTEELFVRYEEDTQYTFNESGTYVVMLKTRIIDEEYDLDSISITITIPDSRLEFPNAFSPNGEDPNNIFRAKRDYRSIVKFHAYILNRWGHVLFDWTDPAEGWDGTYKGKAVKDGVYFLLCKATGADGIEYNIRKDVNLLRNFTRGTTTGNE